MLPPVWKNDVGALPMASRASPVVTRKRPERVLPGPGDYEPSQPADRLGGSGHAGRMSESARFSPSKAEGPNPGAYDTRGSLLKPSFNVLLSDK